jgi:hypothetical protein
MVNMVAKFDKDLAADIAKGIGVDPPADEMKIKEAAKDARPQDNR